LQPFIQVLWISSVNMVAASIYVYMQFFPTPPALIIVGEFAWFFVHGSPPFIYLTMNKTIRRESSLLFRRMLGTTGHNSTLVGPGSGLTPGSHHHHHPTACHYHNRNHGDVTASTAVAAKSEGKENER
jgi:nematode chemoreceptor